MEAPAQGQMSGLGRCAVYKQQNKTELEKIYKYFICDNINGTEGDYAKQSQKKKNKYRLISVMWNINKANKGTASLNQKQTLEIWLQN